MLDHLLAGTSQQQGSGIRSSDATALQIKKLILLQLAHGGAMGTAHVIGDDFQLRFGVNPGPIRKQEIATQLGSVGALGIPGNADGSIENGVGAVSGNALLELIKFTIRSVEPHSGVGRELLLG